MSSTSTEYERILQTYDTIISQLTAARSSGELADKLYSRKLISHGVHVEATNTRVLEVQRIRSLIGSVHAKVQMNEQNYYIFLDILKEITGLEDVVQLLQQDTKLPGTVQPQQFQQEQEEIKNQPGVMEQIQTKVISGSTDAAAPTLTPPVSPANTQPQPKATQKMKALEDDGPTTVNTPCPSTLHEDAIMDISVPPDNDKVKGVPPVRSMESSITSQSLLKTEPEKVFGCGCGSCSFLSFIAEGCPQPITTRSGLPYLDTSQLNKDEKDLLVGQLIGESKEMMFTFQCLVFQTSQSFRNRQISPQLIGESLLCLGTLDPAFSGPQVPLFSAVSAQLMNASSITDIIHAIYGYLSFFNYHVIEHLIQFFGTQEDREEMQKYKEKLKEYCERRVFECPPLYSLPVRSNHVIVAVKLDDDLTKYTLKTLQDFWLRLAKELKLLKHSLRIVSVEEGCMQIMFEIPSLVSCQIFPLSIGQENALQDEKVIELRCEDYIFSSKATPLERSEETNQCFDMIAALLDAGVPHIVLLIMDYMQSPSLSVAEQVSNLWREIIQNLAIWKEEVERNVETNSMWQGIFDRRELDKYVSQEAPHSESISYIYRQLHRSISKDIHSLEINWRRGHYTLTSIDTGSPVKCLQYNQEKIVSGHSDHTIKIWDKNTLKLLKILRGHQNRVYCLQFNDHLIISGSWDNSVKVWDIQTGQLVKDLLHHKDWVMSLKFNSELLVTGSNDKTVGVWVFKSPTDITFKMVLKGHQGYVCAVELSDTSIMSGSLDKSIMVWDSSSGELLHTLQHNRGVQCLQCRGSHIVSGCGDGTIRLWDFETGLCLRKWKGHENYVKSIAFDDNRIVTGSYMTVKVWSMSAVLEPSSAPDSLCITTLKEHSDWVRGVQFDEFELVSGGYDGIKLHSFWEATHHIPGS